MARTAKSIDSLPNELLLNVLDQFPTRTLLPLAAVSRQFRRLVGRVQYYRLVAATGLPDRELLLECYQPSDKLSTPSLFCEYLGTDGLDAAGDEADVGVLNGLYSRFKLFYGEENRRPRARWPTARVVEGKEAPLMDLPSYDIYLEAGEAFTQLCAVTNLLKIGPIRGLFLSIISIGDGVIRVWRDWLREQAAKPAGEQQRRGPIRLDDPCILWTDVSKNVGVRFRVLPKEDGQTPILVGPDDEPAESYTLEYKELIVRTNRLVLGLEESEAQQVAHAGKAIVIAS
ncbi:hypothetical protein GGS20DRAFT_577786 [Poronia punctata]|nr:hypothetical protein GGS20DRAFT_577786 [Poronia punctata]